MQALGFVIERLPPALEGAPPRYLKVRDDGRRGPCVGDEGPLWDALQEVLAENARLKEQLAALTERRRK